MFDEMISAIQQGTVQTLFRVTVRTKVERVQTIAAPICKSWRQGRGKAGPAPRGKEGGQK